MLSVFNQLSENEKSKTDHYPVWFKRLKEYIVEENQDISLTNLSVMLNIHPVHLSREFHKYFKITLGQYIRYLRVNKAISLILNGKQSMAEVCYACGFYDQSHFIRDFKRIYKNTPGSFQQKCRLKLYN